MGLRKILIPLYQQCPHLRDATFHKIEHEDALVATVYKVSLLNGNKYILKVCTRPNDYFCEIYFLKFFADKILVPSIVDLVKPTSDLPGAILMECLSGDLLKKSNLNESLAYEIGII